MNKAVIDVKDIIVEVGAEEDFSFEQEFKPITTESAQIEFAEPVKFDIKAENTGNGMRVTGHITSSLRLVCSRCLSGFDFPVDWKIDEIFYSGEPPEEEAYTMKDSTIDLGPPTEEAFVLAIPMKPLCREACEGICPECGEKITPEHKPHETVKIDARLEVLRKLLKEEGND